MERKTGERTLRWRLEEWELHHTVGAFLGVVLLTIAWYRLSTLVIDPNPVIRGLEIHHFDYGLVLLILTTIVLLFRQGKHPLMLVVAGYSIGSIIDELWFIRSSVSTPVLMSGTDIYRSTLGSAILLLMLFVIIVLLIDHLKTKGVSEREMRRGLPREPRENRAKKTTGLRRPRRVTPSSSSSS